MGDNRWDETSTTDYTAYANMISNYEEDEYGNQSITTDEYTTGSNTDVDDDDDDDTYEQTTEEDTQYESDNGTSVNDDDGASTRSGSSSGSKSRSGSGSGSSSSSSSGSHTGEDTNSDEFESADTSEKSDDDDDNDVDVDRNNNGGLTDVSGDDNHDKQISSDQPDDNDGNHYGSRNSAKPDVEAQRDELFQKPPSKSFTTTNESSRDNHDNVSDVHDDQSSDNGSIKEDFDDEFGFGAPHGGPDRPESSRQSSKRQSKEESESKRRSKEESKKLSKERSRKASKNKKKDKKKKQDGSISDTDSAVRRSAFPSLLAPIPAETESVDTRERDIIAQREKLLLDREYNVNQRLRRFSRWMLILAVLICAGAATLVTLYVLEPFGKTGDDSTTTANATAPTVVPNITTEAPTVTPSANSPTTLVPTSSPSLPPNQVALPIDFFGIVPDGIEEGVTGEEIQGQLESAFDELALEILTELSSSNVDDGVTEEGVVIASEDFTVRRNLEGLSVKTPVSVDVLEVCKYRSCQFAVGNHTENVVYEPVVCMGEDMSGSQCYYPPSHRIFFVGLYGTQIVLLLILSGTGIYA